MTIKNPVSVASNDDRYHYSDPRRRTKRKRRTTILLLLITSCHHLIRATTAFHISYVNTNYRYNNQHQQQHHRQPSSSSRSGSSREQSLQLQLKSLTTTVSKGLFLPKIVRSKYPLTLHLFPFLSSWSRREKEVNDIDDSSSISNENNKKVQNDNFNNNNNNNNNENLPIRVPFIIEQLSTNPNPNVFNDISQMCINAFFNDDTTSSITDDTTNNNNTNIKNKLQVPSFIKEYQLNILRNLQKNDLTIRRRKSIDNTQNMMFVAYEVIPIVSSLTSLTSSTVVSKNTPLLLDISTVYNKESLQQLVKQQQQQLQCTNVSNSQKQSKLDFIQNNNVNGGDSGASCDYIRGNVIGFVEVTQRAYGLGDFLIEDDDNNNNNVNTDDSTNGETEYNKVEQRIQPKGDTASIGIRRKVSNYKLNQSQSQSKYQQTQNKYKVETTIVRPLLTNLSVNKNVRSSGVGSALVSTIEHSIVQLWNMYEIILEVEYDNINAIQFYKNRYYTILYEDPTCRKYDVSGLWLQEKRCKRYIFRKSLAPKPIESNILSSLSSSDSNTNGSTSSSETGNTKTATLQQQVMVESSSSSAEVVLTSTISKRIAVLKRFVISSN